MKLRNRLFLAFFLFAFVPVSLVALVTLELAGRSLERAASPGIARALVQARELVDGTHRELARRARTDLEGPLPGALDFAAVSDGADTLLALGEATRARLSTAEAEGLPRLLVRRAARGDSLGRVSIAGLPAVFAVRRDGARLSVGGYLLPPEQGAQLDGLAADLRSFEHVELLAALNRRFLRVVWLAGSLGYLMLIVIVTRWTARGLTRPLARLGDLVETVGPGCWDVRLDYDRRDEIGALVDGFNRMSARLAETTERMIAAEKTAAWQQTARTIAHGIKNVLAPIKLALSRLAPGPTDASGPAEPLGTLRAELDRLERIARDFSTYGRPVEGPRTPVDLNLVVRQAVELCQGPPPESPIALSPAPAPAVVSGEWGLVREALVNLLRNGREAAGAEGRVTVAVAREGDTVVVTVGDDGPGIDPALGDRIFEPYVTTRSGGTGLGLAIVRKIAHSLDGSIEVATGREGTTFFLRLPAHGETGGAQDADRRGSAADR